MEVEMKMVKSLLLGTAAGLVAVAGAQAADMPVKAAPVQYVKICSLYGDGFYYIPGTDICLKIGGYVRGEYFYNYGASGTQGGFQGVSGQKDRFDGADFLMRTRAYAWFDSRQQTEYGTLRSYLQIGVNYDSPTSFSSTGAANGFSANRAFIQFAGFTVGTAQSFYDFYSSPASSYFGPPASDTGDGGWKVFAYTAQYGNGFSATFSFEEPRNFGTAFPQSGVLNTNLGNLVLGVNTSDADRAKTRFPDIVQNWRVDQAWGSAQIMVAAHDVSGGYYAANNVTAGTLAGLNTCSSPTAGFLGAGVGTLTGSEICGHPADKVGWAVGAGSKHNVGSQGDYFQWQANYTQGAIRYVGFTPAGAFSPNQFLGQNLGYGFWSDAVFSNATGEVQLTTAWGINAAYDHLWLPNFRTSIYGSYWRTEYGDNANRAICNAQTTANIGISPFATPSAVGGSIAFTPLQVVNGTCNNNFNYWTIGSRTQYNFTPWFYVGFDVIYQKLETASNGATVTYTALGGTAKPTAFYQVTDQENYGLRIRVHRDIVP
jgi:porin-like protein